MTPEENLSSPPLDSNSDRSSSKSTNRQVAEKIKDALTDTKPQEILESLSSYVPEVDRRNDETDTQVIKDKDLKEIEDSLRKDKEVRKNPTLLELADELAKPDEKSPEELTNLLQKVRNNKQLLVDSIVAKDPLSIAIYEALENSNSQTNVVAREILANLIVTESLSANPDQSTFVNLTKTALVFRNSQGFPSDGDKILTEFLANHIDELIPLVKKINPGEETDDLNFQAMSYLLHLKPIINYGDTDPVAKAYRKTLNFFDPDNPQIPIGCRIVNGLIYDPQSEASQGFGWAIITDRLIKFGLNPRDLTRDWAYSNLSEQEKGGGIEYGLNFQEANQLEQLRPGITKLLHDEFGISDFGRYPNEALIKQFDERDVVGKPYGVVVYPRVDITGAFYQDAGKFKALLDQLGDDFSLRFYEADSSRGIVRVINNSRKKYGPIESLIIGGHGNPNFIEMGYTNNSVKGISSDETERIGASALETAFIENPTVILISCSTGELGGIGQKISALGEHGATVLAPDKTTGFKAITAQKDEFGKYRFQVEFSDQDTRQTYTKGTNKNTSDDGFK